MGTFGTTGIAAELEKFDLKRKGADEAVQKAVQAGGKALAKRLQEAAPELKGHRAGITPGALKKSIKAGKVTYSAVDGYHTDVGPVGKDHGEALAKIGNILEYGRSAQSRDPGRDITAMPAKPWFNTTVGKAEGEVVNAMRKAFNEAQK